MKYLNVQITIFTGLILLFLSIHSVSAEDERISDKVYFSFEKEQKIWDKWYEENMNIYRLEPLYLVRDCVYHNEVERRLATYYQDADFFLIYFERNIDNGILQTTLFIEDSNRWNRIDWVEDRDTRQPLVVETKHEIANFDREVCERAMVRRFYLGVENYLLLGGTTIYIYIFNESEIGRFAFYGFEGFDGISSDQFDVVKQLLSEVR